MITQRNWRIVGAISIVAAGIMAVLGNRLPFVRAHPLNFAIYWGVFLVLFLVALYCAWLDFRYIRLEYALAKRQIFRETVGEENLRKALANAIDKPKGNGHHVTGNGKNPKPPLKT